MDAKQLARAERSVAQRKIKKESKAAFMVAQARAHAIRVTILKQALGPAYESTPPMAKVILFATCHKWAGTADQQRYIDKALDLNSRAVEGCLKNKFIEYTAGQEPTIRLEFENAFVTGCLGEAIAAAENKSTWGSCVGIHPLKPDDYVHPQRLTYEYKETSIYNQRVEQRKRLKKMLGKEHRKLVKLAMRSTKTEFLKDAAPIYWDVVRSTFDMPLDRFWRVARGKELLPIPKPAAVQLTLFGMEDA